MPQNEQPQIFNRRLVRMRRERSGAGFDAFGFLHRRAMEDIVDRLETVKRDFPRAVFSGAGDLASMLSPACGVGEIISMDLANSRLPQGCTNCFVADEEALPLKPVCADLFVSMLTLHNTNDPVGAMTQARMALKPDGLFVAAVFGEETLKMLRQAFYRAEAEVTGGVSARIAPFATIQDLGRALSRAGFALPVVDVDKIVVRYEDPLRLLNDLRGMGETSALNTGPATLRREALMRAMQIFGELGGEEKFEIVFLTGWAPHESQPKPLPPGSAKTSMAAAVKKNIN